MTSASTTAVQIAPVHPPTFPSRSIEVKASPRELATHLLEERKLWWTVGSSSTYWSKGPLGDTDEVVAYAKDLLAVWSQEGGDQGQHHAFLVHLTRRVEIMHAPGPLRVIRCPKRIEKIAWSPNGRWLAAAGGEDGTGLLYDTQEFDKPHLLSFHQAGILGLSFSPDSLRLATASVDRTVAVWGVPRAEPKLTYSAHPALVRALAWSPDGSHLASGSIDGVHIWLAKDGQTVQQSLYHRALVIALAWSPDGRHVASAGEDHQVVVCDTTSGQARWGARSSARILAMAWAPVGGLLACGLSTGDIQLWGAASGDGPVTFHATDTSIQALAWSPEGAHLASASQDGAIALWDVKDWRAPLKGWRPGERATDVAWSREGHLASVSGETLFLFDKRRLFTGLP